MSDLPALPIWEILYLNGISLVLTGYLVALLDDAWGKLPPLKVPYAEI
jgi:hypothetical protein